MGIRNNCRKMSGLCERHFLKRSAAAERDPVSPDDSLALLLKLTLVTSFQFTHFHQLASTLSTFKCFEAGIH